MATRLLRQALKRGFFFSLEFHRDRTWERFHDHPPFRALTQPKDGAPCLGGCSRILIPRGLTGPRGGDAWSPGFPGRTPYRSSPVGIVATWPRDGGRYC
jgi:hypothetical protein